MKTLTTNLKQHLEGDLLTLATCWKITRADGVVLGLTDHTQDLLVEGLTYRAAEGGRSGAVMTRSGLAVDDLEIEGVLSSSAITEEDVQAGRYDGAAIEVFQVNYQAPVEGRLILRRGHMGEIRLLGGQYVAEIRGMMQSLAQVTGELYSSSCRARLGDGRCGVNLAGFSHSGSVTSVATAARFSDSTIAEASGWYSGGVLTFTSGANAGIAAEVKEHYQKEMILSLPMGKTVTAGDAFTLVAGCDKRFATCREKFDNAVNFRGEPHVPGMDKMLETAGTRSS